MSFHLISRLTKLINELRHKQLIVVNCDDDQLIVVKYLVRW